MGAFFLFGVDIVADILVILGRTNIILLLVKVAFHDEGILWKMFGDKACRQART